jgi:hypothetical protein
VKIASSKACRVKSGKWAAGGWQDSVSGVFTQTNHQLIDGNKINQWLNSLA